MIAQQKGYKTMNNEIQEAINFFKNWIERDLKELDGDIESDYAKFVLDGHKHIRTAIKILENKINVTHGYAE